MTETATIRSDLAIARRWTVIRGQSPYIEYWDGHNDWTHSYSAAATFDDEQTAERVAEQLRRASE